MTITRQQVDAWDDEVDDAYKRGLHDGIKQERALWELSRLGQEIEAQPEQEPVAYQDTADKCRLETVPAKGGLLPQRTLVGLTDEEIEKGRDQTFSINNPYCPCDSKTMRKAVRWAEAKLKEKNT